MKIDWREPRWTAGMAAVCCGVTTHMFGLVTMLHNNDDIGQMPYGYGTGLTSGRWFLTILGDTAQALGFGYNLNWVNGILFLLLIGLAAVLTVDILQLHTRWFAGLTGALFAVFPSVTATMFFRYTVVYYGISLVLSLTAVWLTERYRFGGIPAVLCLALSMGIYQAYVPFAITLFVLLLLRMILREEGDFSAVVRRGLYDCLILAAGVAVYFVLLKVCLAAYGTELSDYNGVNNMGKLSLAELPKILKETVYGFCMLPLKSYCGLAGMKLIRIAYILLALMAGGALAWILLRRVKKPLMIMLGLMLCAVLPVAINFIKIMCPDGFIYTLMVYPFVLIGCIPMVILEAMDESCRAKLLVQKSLVAVLAVLALCYAYETNISYSTQYYASRQTENYLNSMIAQVRMTEGFDTDKKWAFIGQIEDPLLRSSWDYECRFGGNEPAFLLLNRETRWYWFQVYCGYSIPMAEEARVTELCQKVEVQQMPCWPNYGSVKVIGDYVVIKFQDIS